MHLYPIVACICEGSSEAAIIDILLDDDRLIFSREDLLDNKVIRKRQGKSFEKTYLRKEFASKISVVRILDSDYEYFKISKAYEHKVCVHDIVTKPEI